jgi:predicted TIM-barrel enzyme
MTGNFERVFGDGKPVIGMVHLGALPGSPWDDREGGTAEPVEAAARDPAAPQAAGFDAVMFGIETDRRAPVLRLLCLAQGVIPPDAA